MRKTFIVVLAALACAACAKEVLTGTADGVSTFTATITEDSRTAIQSDGNVFWRSGDAISVNGLKYTTKDNDTKTAAFTAVSAAAEPVEGNYYAYYPEQIYSAGSLVLPEVQNGGLKGSGAPMYAVSTTTEFYFTNLCGVLKLNVNKEGTTLSKIVVEANEPVCGPFTISNGAAVLQEGGAKKVKVFFGAGASISSATDFYVSLPAGTYTGMKITFVDNNGSECVKTAKDAITISRNSIKPIVFTAPLAFETPTTGVAPVTPCNGRTECEWVQLWADGPKFACYNVGSNGTTYADATNMAALGEQYYAWGGTTDKDLTDYSTSTTALAGDNDTATKLWGKNWRMMNQNDLKALKENCTLTKYNKGADGSPYPLIGVIVARGKGDYEGNMLVFPQAGNWTGEQINNSGSNAMFWLSNRSSGKAARVQWNSGTFSFNAIEPNQVGVNVRAIYEPTEVEDDNPTRGKLATTPCNGRTECEWVQLWENGPKFACYNVGSNGTSYADATSITSLGEQYYAWGGSTNKDLSDYSTSTTALEGDNDTATKLWGSNWRMMSQADFQGLTANCNITKYNKGAEGSPYPLIGVVVARGKGEYEGNMLVLPQAGSWNGTSVSNSGTSILFWLNYTSAAGKAARVQWESGAFKYYSKETNGSAVSVRAVVSENAEGLSKSVMGGVDFSESNVSGNNGWI